MQPLISASRQAVALGRRRVRHVRTLHVHADQSSSSLFRRHILRHPSAAKNIQQFSSNNTNTSTKNIRQFGSNNNASTRTKQMADSIQISPTVGAAALVFGGAIAARFLYGQLTGLNESKAHHGAPRRDESRVTVRISTEAYHKARADDMPQLTANRLADKSKQTDVTIDDSRVELKSVDAQKFTSFVSQQRTVLQEAKIQSKSNSAQVLHKELNDALTDAEGRINAFADWYFAYKTTYTLLGVAMSSAARHAVTFRTENTLSEAVTEDIVAHVRRKYEALVLRPAITDPMVHRAFVRSLKAAHSEYMAAVQGLEESVSLFVSKEAEESYSRPPRPDQVVIDMDWAAQMQKVEHVPLAYEKNPELSLAIVAGGAAAGKVAGASAVGAAVKMLSAKLAAPFATKAAGATLAKAATAGAAGGAALAGPAGSAAGAAAGAAIGLGVDTLVNAGVALIHRSAFEKDVKESLRATALEWEDRLMPELERVQDVWFGHAESLLKGSVATTTDRNHVGDDDGDTPET